MHHPIDPKIDCVFKALLGSESNRALLIHFLNAILGADLGVPIVWVDILNPYNDKEFLDDKLSIVDVKARDERGRLHQIEIQLLSYRDLPARILYTWADLYSSQLHSGEDYRSLQSTYAIWLLGEDLLADTADYVHDFRLRDAHGRCLLDHGGIWLLELNKFQTEQVQTERERWLKFFKDGERLDAAALPTWMQTAEMRQAMSTLKTFSEKDRAYHAYQARQNYLREQRSIQRHLDELRAEAEQAQAETTRAQAETARAQAEATREREAAERERATATLERAAREEERAEKEAALAEIERLKAQLHGRSHTE
ncbi:Rpn family recombination-promoting nuclease/putative transposase [Thiorhodococcus mannitoliphagus]|uniref:Rpn family recombination-promoting nuclease/putative transposase n=1 Tax=Thiorhodococcus mannitoliphagus TaxID=329406 RepID=A0A6P1DNM1_9GAMM|nr:Rpn family recombination-promoting nuclease/putative transposase [Thiorhodococcus mannitoliphagus]NEX18793.1 Rpn family recombination-promoting nuclease/putative transposase [Thiorhodococcus mannitoliphagus]